MKRWVQAVALLLLIVCAVWLGVLWFWEQSQHQPDTRDAVLYLGVLPALLWIGALLLVGAWGAVVVPARAAAAPVPEPAGAAPSAAASSGEAERQRSHTVLSAHLQVNAGSSAAAVMSALRGGEVRPDLDPELRDAAGLPILSGRIPELDLAALDEALAPWLDGDAASQRLGPRTLRALAALREPLQRTAQDLALWPQLLADEAHSEAPPAAGPRPQLRVLALVAPEAPAAERALVQAWLLHSLVQAGGLDPDRVRIEPLAADATTPGALWRAADRLQTALARERLPDCLLLVAAGSAVDDRAVDDWAARGRLFHAQARPKGLMPSEGAAVLALGPSDWPLSPAHEHPLPQMHRVAVAERDKSVEAAGRVSSRCLEDTVDHALRAAGLPAEAVQGLSTDADQHSPRNGELFGAVLARLAHLDVNDDMALLGAAAGHLEPAGGLAAVVLAAHQVMAEGEEAPQHALALSVAHPTERWACVLRRGARTVAPA